ncbi:MAG TPA: M28 family metallopeptidase [Sphingomonas sp.]
MFRTIAALPLLALAASVGAQDQTATALNARIAAPLPADQAAMKAHVLFLADDALKGREAGTPEFDIAAAYVAAQFYAAGLRPAGNDGGYRQRVPLVSYRSASKGDMVWSPSRGGAPAPLAFGVDYVPAANPARANTSVSAPVVFVGYGIVAPQYRENGYAGVDVRGKIVAVIGGAPARFGGEERAFFGSPGTKATIARDHGAIGIVNLPSARSRAQPFARQVESYENPRITWARPDGTGNAVAPEAPVLATLSDAGATKLFARAATSWTKVAAEAQRDDARFKAAALPGTLSVATRTAFTALSSSNVAGIIPGADPVLGKEVVVLSAHLDHIGVSKTGAGDRINNGALDNAIGIASLIEEAKRFATSGQPPKRSILFLAVTGEEKGLVGSDYFVNNPLMPLSSIVADVNLDMPILTYKFEDMIVYGAERSTLGPIVRRAIGTIGVGLSPDPMPEQGIFVRSDHFRFVQKGIPSVFLWPGPKGAGKAATDAFMANNYHKPSDDLSQPIMWDQGIRFVDANYRIAREIADGPERPVWNKGDYFGTLYKGPMAR